MKKLKKDKKISPYELQKQNIKIASLEQRLIYLKNTHMILKEKFNAELKAYNEACQKLEIKEKTDQEMPEYKKDVKKMNVLEKQKKELNLIYEHRKNEHLSIKQTLEEYEEKKKKLKNKCNLLLKENNELKNKEETIDYNLNERKTEKKGLEEFLEEKIKEETELRRFYENELKKYKEKKVEFVPPNKKFDIMVNINGMNNNINNNLYNLNLSNVEENSENKKEENSMISENINIKIKEHMEDKSESQISKNKFDLNNDINKGDFMDNTENLYSSKMD